jgi:rod shape-determining protein MreD
VHKVTRLQIYSALLLALVVHMTVLHYFRIFGAKPDLLLLLVIFFGLFLGARMGLEVGIIAGLLKDIFAFDIFGVNMFVLGITGLLAGILNTKFYRESMATQATLVFSFSVFSMVLHYVLASSVLKFVNLSLFDYLGSSIIPAGIYTAIVAMPLFPKLIEIYGLADAQQFL